MAGLKWNTGKLYYSTVELGYQQTDDFPTLQFFENLVNKIWSVKNMY
jgi:hypothetical protein